ncbi:MAG: hypothetical protein JXL84_15100 [Deltaproteobacteria bacterium]|nr:hypothetical protein [Deltaproteobacteria bacterium]
MAEKGARARLEEVAFRMYADGKTLTEIEETLGVSRQSLSEWKARTKTPGEEFDEWDKARRAKRSAVQRLRVLFDRELTAIEESAPGSVSSMSLDAVTKLGTLVQRWEATEAGPGYDRAKVFLENVQWIAGWLKDNDPEGLKILAADFDMLTMAFKGECLSGNA